MTNDSATQANDATNPLFVPSESTVNVCPYPDCGTMLTTAQAYKICPKCARPAVRCERHTARGCRSWNRPIAVHCRGCGRRLLQDWFRDSEVSYRNRCIEEAHRGSTASWVDFADKLQTLTPPAPEQEQAATVEVDAVAGLLWVGYPDGSFNLINPVTANNRQPVLLARADASTFTTQLHRWLAAADGPWLAVSSMIGLRVFSLLGAGYRPDNTTLADQIPGGWRCPAGEVLVAPPVFAEVSSISATPGEIGLYWVTRRTLGGPDPFRLWGVVLRVTEPGCSKVASWSLKELGLKSPGAGAALAALRPDVGSPGLKQLILASGRSLLAVDPPDPSQADRGLPPTRASETTFDMAVGQYFGNIPGLAVLPPHGRDWTRRSAAVELADGMDRRMYARINFRAEGCEFGPVADVGNPIGAAQLPGGPVWVYLNGSTLGTANTMDHCTPVHTLQKTDHFVRARVSGRIVALSGQNDTGRPIVRVYDLIAKRAYYRNDTGQQLFPLPVAIGTELYTVDEADDGSTELLSHTLAPAFGTGDGT